jgi:hypothetical protein
VNHDFQDSNKRDRLYQSLNEWKSHQPIFLVVAVLLRWVAPSEVASVAQKIFRRWKASNQDRQTCVWLVQHRDDLDSVDVLPLHVLKRLAINPGFEYLLDLLSATERKAQADWCRAFLAAHSPEQINPKPLLTGDDLKAQGWESGPHFKDWLDRVRNAQLDGSIHTQSEAMELVRQWHRQRSC